jgi:hypothetical protein
LLDGVLDIGDDKPHVLSESYAWQASITCVLQHGLSRDVEEIRDVGRVSEPRPL